jgi:hypothetical protein
MRWFGVALLLACVVVSAGSASNSASFVDASGDSGSAPDITNWSVSNDNQGLVEFRLEIANRSLALDPNDFFQLFIDADGAASTGPDGFETGIEADADGGSGLFRFDNGEFTRTDAPSLESLFAWNLTSAAWNMIISISFRDLASQQLRFFAYSDSAPADDAFWDEAPDSSALNYTITIPLLRDKFDPPKPAKAGKAFGVSMSVVTSDSVAPRTVCAAKIGRKRVRGNPGWSSTQTPIGYRGLLSCAFKVPRSAKGKRIAGTIVATKGGVTVRQAFSSPIR